MKTQQHAHLWWGSQTSSLSGATIRKGHGKLLLHIRSPPAPQVKASEETRTPFPSATASPGPRISLRSSCRAKPPGAAPWRCPDPAAGTARAPPRQGPQMSSPPRGASRSQRSQGPDSTGRRRPRPLPARPEGSSPRTPEPGSCPPKARRSLESFHSLSLSLGTPGTRARGGKAAVPAPTRETTGRGGGPRAGPRA